MKTSAIYSVLLAASAALAMGANKGVVVAPTKVAPTKVAVVAPARPTPPVKVLVASPPSPPPAKKVYVAASPPPAKKVYVAAAQPAARPTTQPTKVYVKAGGKKGGSVVAPSTAGVAASTAGLVRLSPPARPPPARPPPAAPRRSESSSSDKKTTPSGQPNILGGLGNLVGAVLKSLG